MIIFRKAKENDIPAIMNVMQEVGYLNFEYKNQTKQT